VFAQLYEQGHNICMATVQVPDVGEKTLRTLEERAARAGQSLEVYLQKLLDEEAATLTPEELEDEVRDIARHSSVTNEDVLAVREQIRRDR
jgi:plasmid stability protein